ncbi:NUDIX hydrolase [Butyrivibrio sp. CB08]|uniref:NUDIX hydrolase n=1 Tax=Butyrivibrio sp. CB08 TaxID=2364879 RepID=UPI000EA930F9|nr:NUDIX hydrolase [Butyrivibrio sp. CB08]RKM57567.1 NUDIX hydrolase [Butyrivibrio sp. CB08]
MSDNLGWELVKEEHVIQDQWIDFRRNIYRLPNNAEIGPVYNYSKHSFVVIVARDKEGRYICVKQYRHGVDRITTEFPAGGIEYKEKSDVPYITKENTIATEEEALDAANRELLEETGYVAGNIRHLLTIPANATLASNNFHIYLATDCEKKSSQHLDDTEFLNVLLLSEDELKQRIFGGDFIQSHHILSWYIAKDLG